MSSGSLVELFGYDLRVECEMMMLDVLVSVPDSFGDIFIFYGGGGVKYFP